MERNIKELLGRREEDNLVNLWREVQLGVKSAATEAGIEIVLGYADPCDPEMRDGSANAKRRMKAIDMGTVLPLFIAPRANHDGAVVELLNRSLRDPAKKAAPR